ncbi:helix-turn-helix domain-containing protein [Gephyromycinifex aptenodytis]|uniref:helix-turn-helix domain-containing protein n=1 Tax=Gephyromycinifex aptenodytis TaxID=2716227 RepID=UPI001D010448|nr:helix-turn-helix transcriptional regulator [Gephyromycinifex aptenodytis]
MSRLTPPLPGMRELGEYLREQREHAQLSVRQLSAMAGVSNPYLSQIERGLKKPSAEILQALAKGLQISAESLYVRAGLLDGTSEAAGLDVRQALKNDVFLTERQRRLMIDLYDSFVPADAMELESALDPGVDAEQVPADHESGDDPCPSSSPPSVPASRASRRSTRQSG